MDLLVTDKMKRRAASYLGISEPVVYVVMVYEGSSVSVDDATIAGVFSKLVDAQYSADKIQKERNIPRDWIVVEEHNVRGLF